MKDKDNTTGFQQLSYSVETLMLKAKYGDLVHEDGSFWVGKEHGSIVVLHYLADRDYSVEVDRFPRTDLSSAIVKCSALAAATEGQP